MTGSKMSHPAFSPDLLQIDCAAETARICDFMVQTVLRNFRKKGVVVALSGGIDSSVVGALAVRAFGKERVFGLLMPERDSSADTLSLSRGVAEHLGIRFELEDISGMLDAAGCYKRRDDAIRRVAPEYTSECRSKISLPSVTDSNEYRLFSVVIRFPDGSQVTRKLDLQAYLGVVAATNFKQRCRKMLEYYHADRLNYAVSGTPNKLEYDQGFFVKLGDGAADIKPIAHLYKTQVYAMARHLGLPAEICNRTPTTDTYSLPQTQEEFYFSLPYDKMDLVLLGKEDGYPAEEIGRAIGLSAEQVERVFRDIEAKRRMASYLHSPPILLDGRPAHSTAAPR